MGSVEGAAGQWGLSRGFMDLWALRYISPKNWDALHTQTHPKGRYWAESA